jgi:hypothetical protein
MMRWCVGTSCQLQQSQQRTGRGCCAGDTASDVPATQRPLSTTLLPAVPVQVGLAAVLVRTGHDVLGPVRGRTRLVSDMAGKQQRPCSCSQCDLAQLASTATLHSPRVMLRCRTCCKPVQPTRPSPAVASAFCVSVAAGQCALQCGSSVGWPDGRVSACVSCVLQRSPELQQQPPPERPGWQHHTRLHPGAIPR